MSRFLSGRGSAALLVASVLMTLMAVVVAAGVAGAASAGELINRVLATIGATTLAAYSYRSALEVRRAELEAKALVPALVRVRR